MANIRTDSDAAASRNHRRVQALVARIITSEATSVAEVDFSDPIFRKATVDELILAFEVVMRDRTIPMESSALKWMNGASEWSCGKEERWMPLRDALYEDLNGASILHDSSMLAYNDIAAFQVCYGRGPNYSIGYHIQLLNDPSHSACFILKNGVVSQLKGDLPDELRGTRNPFGTISHDLLVAMYRWTDLASPKEHEKPLHDLIRTSIT